MLVCLGVEKNNLSSPLSVHFESTPYFFFVDTETNEFEVIKSKKNLLPGLEVVHLVTERRPEVVITGNILPNSLDFLLASGIKVALGVFGITGKEALNRFKQGKIKLLSKPPLTGKGRLL